MRVALLGYDTEGRASYEYFKQLGADITICDVNPNVHLPDDVQSQLGVNYLKDLDRFDVIVRTPGLNPALIIEANPVVAPKITSGTNLFFENSPTRNIIGVTGTKGKGTTSTLITGMLQAAGKTVHLGGNIGVPALSLLKSVQPDDWVVLELSSFQLTDLRYSPPLAVCLMIVPEHLNWHRDMADYVGAKAKLFANQLDTDTAIYFGDNQYSRQIAANGHAKRLPYYQAPGAYVDNGAIVIDGQAICQTDEIKLLGTHNWQNACAAVTAAWQVTHDMAAFRTVLTSFSGLPHRLEFVRELDGIRYYDDSFGTTPETAMVAIAAFDQPKVIIIGGSDKSVPFDALVNTIIDHDVSAVVTIGQTGPIIGDALRAKGYNAVYPGGSTMRQIVTTAQQQATSGSVVLLSPACASYDMFENYKQRGELFTASVQALDLAA